MVLSQRDIKERKDRILAMAIEQYIQTVAPVSSQYIAKKYTQDISSATIRNILGELEEEGLLTHPHTSAGRIPTQKGYRYYVDNLMNEIKLLEDEKRKIKREIEQDSRELETLLDKASEVLSHTTHYTGIISVDGWNKKFFCHGTSFIVQYPETPDVQKVGEILSALEEKQNLIQLINRDLAKKTHIYIGHEIAFRAISSCSLVVSPYKTRKGPSGRIAVLGPTRMNYERVVSTVDYLTDLMEEMF